MVAAAVPIAIAAGSALANGATAAGQNNLNDINDEYLRNALSKINAIDLPKFIDSLPPAEQLQLQKYIDPILAKSQGVSIDPNDRNSQMAALQQMQSLASGNANSELNANNYKAMANA